MRHTIIIALLLITLFPNTALAQWGFDAVSVEAYINDHKKQRSLLLARSTLEYSNQPVSYTHLTLPTTSRV